MASIDYGSSPLARGLLITRPRHHIPNRIIPARAGFTRTGKCTSPQDTDHPRSRGVYQFLLGSPRVRGGSSPLARGLLPRINLDIVLLRIIPARAGFTPHSR